MAKQEWTLAELLEYLPRAGHPPGVVLRCLEPVTGSGRYVREWPGQKGFADVKLRAAPSAGFSLRCRHEWPDGLSPAEIEELDRALLRGIAEGTAHRPEPAWRCQIECTDVAYVRGDTTPTAVGVAACLAVHSLVYNGKWVVDGTPGEERA